MTACSVINHDSALIEFFLTTILQTQSRITFEIKKDFDDEMSLSQHQLFSSASAFNLVLLNPHPAHLYIIALPISFSGSISPPQHAHFMATGMHKSERLFYHTLGFCS
jgi:hypothetical protein